MWEFVKTGFDGDCILFGVNIFDYEWTSTGGKIEVLDPIYNQKHMLTIYTADTGTETVRFAAGEFSNCVYGFYTKATEM